MTTKTIDRGEEMSELDKVVDYFGFIFSLADRQGKMDYEKQESYKKAKEQLDALRSENARYKSALESVTALDIMNLSWGAVKGAFDICFEALHPEAAKEAKRK
jgi:hypothetical protein